MLAPPTEPPFKRTFESQPRAADALKVPDTTGGQDVSVMFATLVGTAALTLLVQGILAYMLLPEGRGAYAVCIAFGTLFGLLFTPGALQGAQYFVAARQMSVSQAVSSALMIGLVGGGLAAALAIPLIHSEIAFFQQAETPSFLLSLLLIPLTVLSLALDHQLVALRRFRCLSFLALLRLAANVLMILVFVWHLGLGVNGAVIAFAAARGLMFAVCLLYLRRHCGLTLEWPSRRHFTCIVGYGLKYHPASVGSAVEFQSSVVVLGLLASTAEIGLFSAVSTLMLGFNLVSNSIGSALFPRVAYLERTELVALCLRLVGVATVVPLLAFLALSTPLVRLALSEAFLPAVPLLWIIAPGILAYALSGIFMTHFKGTNLPHVCSCAVFLGLCVNLCALLALYPGLGVEAAAWAMTFGMLCRFLLLAIAFHTGTRMAWSSVWLPRRNDASFLWAAGRSALGLGAKR